MGGPVGPAGHLLSPWASAISLGGTSQFLLSVGKGLIDNHLGEYVPRAVVLSAALRRGRAGHPFFSLFQEATEIS